MDSDLSERFSRLNMNHGFIKYIVRNQISRDEYHKVMEERKNELQKKMQSLPDAEPSTSSISEDEAKTGNGTSKSTTPPGTLPRLYIPPHLRRNLDSSQGDTIGSQASNSFLERNVKNNRKSILSDKEEAKLRGQVRKSLTSDFTDISTVSVPGTRSSNGPQPLFVLRLESEGNQLVERTIFTNDQAARVAKELGRAHSLSDEACRRLRIQLETSIAEKMKVLKNSQNDSSSCS